MRPLVVIAAWLALALPAAAGNDPRSVMETRAAVQQILGGAPVEPLALRIKYLGQETYATRALAAQLSQATDGEREAVIRAISLLGSPLGEKALADVAEDESSMIRQLAAEGLGRMRAVRSAGVLKRLIADPNPGVRRAAAIALGQLKAKAAGKALVVAAKTEGEPEVREALLISAGASGDPKVAPALEAFLKSSSESARAAAARGLCMLGTRSCYAYAKTLIGSKDRYQRLQGAALFEGASSKAAWPALEPLLQDPDPKVAATSARILYQGGAQSMLDFLILNAARLKGEPRMAYEDEIDLLHLSDEQRHAVLKKAGYK